MKTRYTMTDPNGTIMHTDDLDRIQIMANTLQFSLDVIDHQTQRETTVHPITAPQASKAPDKYPFARKQVLVRVHADDAQSVRDLAVQLNHTRRQAHDPK